MHSKDLVRVPGPIGFHIGIGHVDIDDNVGASPPKASDEEVASLFVLPR
jgi:hypothetical protein